MATHSVAKLLGESSELRPLQERLDVINRLQRRYRTIAPGDLAKASRVCAIDGTTVVICAANGPVAAALRQIAPRLLRDLVVKDSLKQNENQELTGVRVEVQVAPVTPKRAVRAREPMPVDRLKTLAKGLSDSPLKETLQRIVRAPQSKRTREKT